MRKKVISLMLSVVLLFTLFLSIPAFGSAAGTITLSKTEFRLNETGTAAVTGLSQEAIDDGAWIGIWAAGARDDQYREYEYISSLPANNTWTFKAPDTLGQYTIKVCLGDDSVYASTNFSVVAVQASTDDIKLSKTEAKINEKISVTVNGLTQEEIDSNAWVGVWKDGAKLDSYLFYEYISILPANNTWEFEVPETFGKYIVRVFSKDTDTVDPALLYGERAFTVVSSKAKAGDITISKSSVQPGEKISVTVNGLTEGEIDANAWVGLFKTGVRHDQYSSYEYINSLPANNTWEISAPSEAGSYEFRVFCKDPLEAAEYEYAMFGKVSFSVGGEPIDEIEPGYGGISNWAVPEVNGAINENLVTDKILIDFGNPLTREEFCELAIKLYERMTGEVAEPVAQNPFTDTKNPEILKAFNLKIVNGVADDKFAPNNTVTRQEIAAMLVRTLKVVMPELSTSNAKFTEKFHDEASVATWALTDLKYLNQNGIFKGSNGYILPKANTTREQGISLVKRVFDKFFDI